MGPRPPLARPGGASSLAERVPAGLPDPRLRWSHDRRPRPRAGPRPAASDQPAPRARRAAVGRPRLGGGGRVWGRRAGRREGHRHRPAGSAGEIPEETAGPFPGDSSDGPNILTESGVVRQDITTSVGDASGVAEGVPTTVNLTLLDVAGGGGPLAGAAVYLWHCDSVGRYSLYDQDTSRGENSLPRRAGERRRRQADLHDGLPGRLPGALAAHALRGLREPRRRDRRRRGAPHVAARHPQEACDSVYATRATPAARRRSRDVAGLRHGVQRRLREPAHAREP